MLFYQGKDEEVADGFSSKPSTCQKGCIPKINMIKLVLGGDKNVVDADTNHRVARMLFLAMNSIDISEEAKVLTVITKNFVKRLNEDAIEQKRKHEVKGYENHGFDTSSKSSLLFEVK